MENNTRFTLKPYTYKQGGKEWTGAGIYDAQGDPNHEMLMSEICALLESQHREITRLQAIEARTVEAFRRDVDARYCERMANILGYRPTRIPATEAAPAEQPIQTINIDNLIDYMSSLPDENGED